MLMCILNIILTINPDILLKLSFFLLLCSMLAKRKGEKIDTQTISVKFGEIRLIEPERKKR